jgi:hypothetical protein
MQSTEVPQRPTEHEVDAALSAILGLTHGGLENARKVIASVSTDGEAARLIATASWGGMGGLMVMGGRGYVEARSQVIVLRMGEIKMTLTPSQWMRRVRRMLAQETNLHESLTPDEDSSVSAESIGMTTGPL